MRFAAAVVLGAAVALWPGIGWAQDQNETRPATPTFLGDTGLWFVPTAETPKAGGFTASLYHTELDYNQGFTNVSFWPITGSVGIGDRVEVFGSVRVITRIDRDTRPLFFPPPPEDAGGLVNEYPFVRQYWSGNDFGDMFLGGKFNILSQGRNEPFGLAVRGIIKVPTADDDTGAGTGKMDFFADLIASRELSEKVEVSGFAGVAMRGDPDDVDLSNSIKWGLGAGIGSRWPVRFTAEVFGDLPFEDNVILSPSRVFLGEDGSRTPLLSSIDKAVNAAFGATFSTHGVSIGVGATWRLNLNDREDVIAGFDDDHDDAFGLQVRLAFHRGVKTYVAPAAPPAAPPPAAAPPAATPAPPAPAPPPAAPPAAARPATQAPPAPGELEDILFDFDRDVIRPDQLPILQRVLAALRANPAARMRIEGHASAEGTAEYNLALGERRALAAQNYLASQGIDRGRLTTLSYGEERPKLPNTSEENRAQNRRAAFVVQ